MSVTGIILAAVIVGGTGLFIGVFLGIAGKKFAVEVDEREEAMAEGHAKGLAEGEQLTLQKMNRLTQLLAKQNRIDDLVKAANDADYQEQLFKEFHL